MPTAIHPHLLPQKAAWSALSACLLMALSACGGEDVESLNSIIDQAVVNNGVPCALVMANWSTTTADYATCPAGYTGYTCRSDSNAVADGKTCNAGSGNPIQAALTWAKNNSKTVVRLDAGTFYVDPPYVQHSNQGNTFAIWVPSNISVVGEGSNTTVLLRNTGAMISGVFLAVADQNSWAPASGTAIQNMIIDGGGIDRTNWGVYAGAASGYMTISGLTVRNTAGGIQLGVVTTTADPANPSQLFLAKFNGISGANNSIRDNTVVNQSGDGIVIIGNYNMLQYNYASTPGVGANGGGGIHAYADSKYNTYYSNTLSNCYVGIVFDGTYQSSSCTTTGCNTNAGIGQAFGYNTNMVVQNNVITQSSTTLSYGIQAFRLSNSTIMWNTITGPLTSVNDTSSQFVGMDFNESDSNFVYGNQVRHTYLAFLVQAHGYSKLDSDGSQKGSSGNVFGNDIYWNSSGNDITENARPFKLFRDGNGQIKGNVIRNNFITTTGTPFYYNSPTEVFALDLQGSNAAPNLQWCSGNLIPTYNDYPYVNTYNIYVGNYGSTNRGPYCQGQ